MAECKSGWDTKLTPQPQPKMSESTVNVSWHPGQHLQARDLCVHVAPSDESATLKGELHSWYFMICCEPYTHAARLKCFKRVFLTCQDLHGFAHFFLANLSCKAQG